MSLIICFLKIRVFNLLLVKRFNYCPKFYKLNEIIILFNALEYINIFKFLSFVSLFLEGLPKLFYGYC